MGTVSERSQSALVLQLAEQMQALQSHPESDTDRLLRDLTQAAVTSVPGADCAGITLVRNGGVVETASATHDDAVILDEIQGAHGEGPCLSAAWQHRIIRIEDLSAEGRWPRFCGDAVEQTPVRAMLSFQLFVDRRSMGALNFYANQVAAFDDEAVESGLIYATHAAVVWQFVRRDEQFRSALASRDVIGQAKGMLMERYGVTAVQAFELLKRLSQNSNTPLVRVAQELTQPNRRR